MNKEVHKMIKNKSVAFVLFVVVCLAVWNILAFVYGSFISGNGYQFEASKGIGMPAIISIMIGYLLFLRKKDED